MNKIIEDELNLPRLADALEELEKQSKTNEEKNSPADQAENYSKMIETYDEIEQHLMDIKDLDRHDKEMDTIYEKALEQYKNLINLGFQVDPKHSGQIFEPAVNLLKISLDAKNSNADKKLRLMKLQLDRARLEMNKEDDDSIDIEGQEIISGDRNHIIEMIKEEEKKKKED